MANDRILIYELLTELESTAATSCHGYIRPGIGTGGTGLRQDARPYSPDRILDWCYWGTGLPYFGSYIYQ